MSATCPPEMVTDMVADNPDGCEYITDLYSSPLRTCGADESHVVGRTIGDFFGDPHYVCPVHARVLTEYDLAVEPL